MPKTLLKIPPGLKSKEANGIRSYSTSSEFTSDGKLNEIEGNPKSDKIPFNNWLFIKSSIFTSLEIMIT